MYRLIVKDIRQTLSDSCSLHITKKMILLPKDDDVRSLVYYNDSTHTIHLFIANTKKEWKPASGYTPLCTIDNRLDLGSFNLVRYLIIGNIDATIENYTSTYVGVSTAKSARVRLFVSGRRLSLRTSIRSRSFLSVCGSANTLEIRSLHADSYLDLTAFTGSHLLKNELDVAPQSIFCSVRLPNDEETSRQRHVRENILLPSLESSVLSEAEPSCLLCCEYQVNVVSIPCNHSCMCLLCAHTLHSQERSMFVCPLCREEIQEVRMLD